MCKARTRRTVTEVLGISWYRGWREVRVRANDGFYVIREADHSPGVWVAVEGHGLTLDGDPWSFQHHDESHLVDEE